MTATVYKYLDIGINVGPCPLRKYSLVIIKAILPMWKTFHRETCYWTIRAVNRAFIIIDSRSDCGTRKNTWRKYCKIGIARYVHKTSDHIIFIWTRTLRRTRIFLAMRIARMVNVKFKQFVTILKR